MADSTIEVLNPISGAGGISAGDLFYVFRPAVTDVDYNATGNDLITFVEGNATAFADASHTHVMSDITDAGDLATLDEITDSHVAAGANIALSKLATDPLDRANHTGTQLMATISDAGDLATQDTINLTQINSGITPNIIVGSDGAGVVSEYTAADVRTLINVEDGADVTDTANVDAAGAVMDTDFNEHTLLVANLDNTPTAVNIAPDEIVGRGDSGGIRGLSPLEARNILGVDASAEENQFAFSRIASTGATDIAADTKTDTLSIEAGTNVTIDLDNVTDTVTINATGSGNTTSPTTHDTNRVPTFDGSNSQVLQQTPVSIDQTGDITGVGDITLSGAINGFDFSADHSKLATIEAGAEVNQNAFSTFSVAGQSDVVADSKTDTVTFVEGDSNIVITTDDATDTITFAVNAGENIGNTFSPATHGNHVLPVYDGVDTQTLHVTPIIVSDTGTMSGIENITLSGTVDGRDVATDGAKLDGIEAGAQVNPNVFTSIIVSGEDTLTSADDDGSLTLVAGANLDITTNAITNEVTFDAIGVGDTFSTATHGDNILPKFDGTDTKTIQTTGITIDDSNNITGAGTYNGRDLGADGSKLDTIQTGAQRTDTSNVDAAGAVMETDYGINTILKSDVNDTPTALSVPSSTIIGRAASGGIDALTAAETRTILNVEDGAQVNQDSFTTISVSGQDDIVADQEFDTLTIVGGMNINVTTDAATDTLTIAAAGIGDTNSPATHGDNVLPRYDGADSQTLQVTGITIDDSNNITGVGTVDGRDLSVDGSKLDGIEAGATADQDVFSTISVTGQSDVVADSTTDSLNLAGGTGITITTDAGTDTVTFDADFADFGALAQLDEVTTTQITDETIVDGDISPTAAIQLSKLAIDPLDRANHTGTQLLSTISDAGVLAGQDSITISQIDDITPDNFIGSDGAGDVVDLTATEARAILNVEDGAQVNQNAFNTVAVSGQTDIVADTATDTLNIVGTGSTTVTTDAGTDTVTINSAVPVFTKSYTSPDTSIVAGGSVNLTHGLGEAPKLVIIELVCTTASDGYSVGDVLTTPYFGQGSSEGVAITTDSTAIFLRFGLSITTFDILNKNDGGTESASNGDWNIRVKAFA